VVLKSVHSVDYMHACTTT